MEREGVQWGKHTYIQTYIPTCITWFGFCLDGYCCLVCLTYSRTSLNDNDTYDDDDDNDDDDEVGGDDKTMMMVELMMMMMRRRRRRMMLRYYDLCGIAP